MVILKFSACPPVWFIKYTSFLKLEEPIIGHAFVILTVICVTEGGWMINCPNVYLVSPRKALMTVNCLKSKPKQVNILFLLALSCINLILGVNFNLIAICSGGNLDYHSQTRRLKIREYKEAVEICCLLPIHTTGAPSSSVIQRSHKNFWHTHWNCMGWSCIQSLSLHACESCEFDYLPLHFFCKHIWQMPCYEGLNVIFIYRHVCRYGAYIYCLYVLYILKFSLTLKFWNNSFF